MTFISASTYMATLEIYLFTVIAQDILKTHSFLRGKINMERWYHHQSVCSFLTN